MPLVFCDVSSIFLPVAVGSGVDQAPGNLPGPSEQTSPLDAAARSPEIFPVLLGCAWKFGLTDSSWTGLHTLCRGFPLALIVSSGFCWVLRAVLGRGKRGAFVERRSPFGRREGCACGHWMGTSPLVPLHAFGQGGVDWDTDSCPGCEAALTSITPLAEEKTRIQTIYGWFHLPVGGFCLDALTLLLVELPQPPSQCVHSPALCGPLDCSPCQAPLSMGFSGQEYWSGLPFPTPGDLPNPGIELTSLASPALDSLPAAPPGKPHFCLKTQTATFVGPPVCWGVNSCSLGV